MLYIKNLNKVTFLSRVRRRFHLSKMSFKLCYLEVVINPLIKSPRTEQGDLLGDG